MFGIEEHKATGYKIKRDITSINVQNQTSATRTVIEDFRFDFSGEKVNINGSDGRFVRWANHKTGGYLRFVQDDTFIEIDRGELSKQMMVELARSIKH